MWSILRLETFWRPCLWLARSRREQSGRSRCRRFSGMAPHASGGSAYSRCSSLKMLLEEHIDDIARMITLENGKTFVEGKAEMRRAIENVEVACGTPMMMQGYNLEDVARGIDEMMIRQPLGVVAAIVPFNFPGMIAFWYLPYAIATGEHLHPEAKRAGAAHHALRV